MTKTTGITKKAFMIALMLMVASAMVSFTDYSNAATNLSKAKKKYKVSDSNIVQVSNLKKSTLLKAIQEAEEIATIKKPAIVHVQKGKINNCYMDIPKNVILVSEKSVNYNRTAFSVSGVVYGGSFDGKKKVDIILEISTNKFGKTNGVVEYTTVKNALNTGISCYKTKATSMNNNKVSNCIKGGIGAYKGANVKSMKNNTITKIGKGKTGSGINIVGANAGSITGNKVTKCKGHGLSTNYYVYKKGCRIKVLDKNTINSNGVHGVYLNRSKITKSMKKNTIKYNKTCGVRIDNRSSVKGMKGNKVKGNRSSDVSNAGRII